LDYNNCLTADHVKESKDHVLLHKNNLKNKVPIGISKVSTFYSSLRRVRKFMFGVSA